MKRASTSSQSSEASAWAEASGSPVNRVVDFFPLSVSPRIANPVNHRNIMEWSFDTLRIDEETGGKSLSFVTSAVLDFNCNLLSGRPEMTAALKRVMARAETRYNTTPNVRYHNHIHGADVMQALHYFLRHSAFFDKLSVGRDPGLMMMAAMCAAGLHDIDHVGLTNSFLVKSGHALAQEHGSTSVLEKHHAAIANSLLIDFPFASRNERNEFLKIVTELILATDLSRHHQMVSSPPVVGEGIESLCFLLHAADVSNNGRVREVSVQWTERLMEEFFHQGDLERELQIGVTPMMDRSVCNVARVQIGFIDVIARPLYVALCGLVDGLEHIVELMDANRAAWVAEALAVDPPCVEDDCN